MGRNTAITIRLSDAEKATIAQRAAASGMKQGPYLIACATGEINLEATTTEQILEDVQARLERLEAAAFNF